MQGLKFNPVNKNDPQDSTTKKSILTLISTVLVMNKSSILMLEHSYLTHLIKLRKFYSVPDIQIAISV